MQILSASHREKLLIQWQKEHKWGTHAEVGLIKDSVGQKLGVLGYGSIGRQCKPDPEPEGEEEGKLTENHSGEDCKSAGV